MYLQNEVTPLIGSSLFKIAVLIFAIDDRYHTGSIIETMHKC
jgi:hypothetical protein